MYTSAKAPRQFAQTAPPPIETPEGRHLAERIAALELRQTEAEEDLPAMIRDTVKARLLGLARPPRAPPSTGGLDTGARWLQGALLLMAGFAVGMIAAGYFLAGGAR